MVFFSVSLSIIPSSCCNGNIFFSLFFPLKIFFLNWRTALQYCFFSEQQCESGISIHIFSPSLASLLHPILFLLVIIEHRAELSPYYAAVSQWISVLHMVVYVCQCYSFNSSHPLLPHFCTTFSLHILSQFFVLPYSSSHSIFSTYNALILNFFYNLTQ